VIGHSLGEYVAATVAGVWALDDALALVAERARLISELPAGAMLGLPFSEAEARAVPGGGAVRGRRELPHHLRGLRPVEAVAALEARLPPRGRRRAGSPPRTPSTRG
jgi:acyl transferase domain-containing protein